MLDVKPRHYSSDREVQIDVPLERYNVHVRGDVCLGLFSEGDKMCQLYFHTGFIKDSILTFEKNVIDMAADDTFHYTFNEALKIEVCLEAIPDDPSHRSHNELPQPESDENQPAKQDLRTG